MTTIDQTVLCCVRGGAPGHAATQDPPFESQSPLEQRARMRASCQVRKANGLLSRDVDCLKYARDAVGP